MPTTPLSRLLDVSKVLANRARLRILAVLEGRELCVGQVAAIFDIARSTASEHLSALRRVGLVVERRDGRFAYYSLVVDAQARKFLDVVLSELSADAAVLRDRELAGRILALPHDLVCEQGRAALNAPIAPAASAADPDSPSCSTSRSNTEHQEVP
ncbi:MAG TPA: metalloregulator ArsR/SmtB family transcription factor [Thermoanaerobaculia bacterium]|nr:metalloregulator ArsR/SmtB family transcription factor [Thermoanaerobaculia bacterium]